MRPMRFHKLKWVPLNICKMPKSNQKSIEDPIPRDLFDILACPLCKADLEYTKDKKGLVCSGCGEKYPIKEGVPVLLPPKERKN